MRNPRTTQKHIFYRTTVERFALCKLFNLQFRKNSTNTSALLFFAHYHAGAGIQSTGLFAIPPVRIPYNKKIKHKTLKRLVLYWRSIRDSPISDCYRRSIACSLTSVRGATKLQCAKRTFEPVATKQKPNSFELGFCGVA